MMPTLALLLLACSTPAPENEAPAAPKERKLTLAAYTTPREAYRVILPAFAADWQQKTGEKVTFEESYQGSGAQARAVREGFEADVVALSLDPDVQLLEEAGLITSDWRAAPWGGMVTRSLVVVAVRPGNPKKILDWSDLGRADVEVLTPNVRTSGGAMWNVLAIWGAGLRGHAGVTAGDLSGATGLLGAVLGRVKVMDKGARESIVSFEKGVGDAAITYEHEVLGARLAGKEMDYVIPSSTIQIENPVAVVDSYAKKHGNEDLALAFLAYLRTPPAQKAFADFGFRPLDSSVAPANLAVPADLFTIQDLGGWAALKTQVFSPGAAYDQAAPK